MPRLLALLATRAASLLNFSELSRSVTLSQSTLKRYIALLETTFLVQFLPAWSSNFGKRLVKSPKILMTDTGLMGHLMGLTPQRLDQEPNLIGPLLENFVAMELRKQITWSEVQPRMFHLRTQTGVEVDIILEDARGSMVGIEVKASGTVTSKDVQSLRIVAETLGRKFIRGIILYTGSEIVPFGPNLHAIPVSSLFES
jgi:predicted AAA+ superfamily ATPase